MEIVFRRLASTETARCRSGSARAARCV